MQSLDALLALAAFAFVMSVTPGPNNVLLLASGLAFGLRRTAGHMAGILTGMFVQIALVGVGLGVLFAREPGIQVALKVVGSLYMLWLTRQLWRAGDVQSVTSARPIRFHESAAFQFVNPKAWLMSTTLIAAFVPPGDHYAQRVLTAALLFTAVGLPSISLWAGCGSALRVWIENPVALRRINRVMAVLAAVTVILFWL